MTLARWPRQMKATLVLILAEAIMVYSKKNIAGFHIKTTN
jgi:hypothetical protein